MLAVVLDHVFKDLDVERQLLGEAGATLATGGARASEADALLVCYARVDAALIDSLAHCRVISRYGVGFDNIDVPAATRRGIVVTYVPDYCVDEVSDHALALLLAGARKVCLLDRGVRAGEWDLAPARPIHRLRGSTLGVVGYGRMGRTLTQKAVALGLRVIAYDPVVSVTPPAEAATFDRLLAESDFVSLHVPLTEATRNLVGEGEMARMKPGALLVNTSRGGLVDEQALYQALRSGRLGGAALDVLAVAGAETPLRELPNVILTPHAAFYSEESQADLQRKAAINAATVLGGGRPADVVNPEVYGSAAG